MKYIEVPTGEDAAKKIVDSHNKGEPLPIFDVLIFLAWLTTLFVTIANNFKLRQMPVENVIAYIKPEDIKQRRIVEGLLTEIRTCANCDRAIVGLFHNGITIGGSKHFDKMSAVYESVRHRIESIKDSVKDIPATRLHTEIEMYAEEKGFSFHSRDKLAPKCISHLDNIGVEVVASRLLTDKQGVFGILHLHWVSKVDDPDLNENEQLKKIFNNLENKLRYVVENRKIPKELLD